jgi:hypothetical protein
MLAKPTYIQSAHQTIWEIGPDLALQPLTELPLTDQHTLRQRFEEIKSDILARIEESEGHAAMTDMHSALIIPNLNSVLVNRSAVPGAPEFVVINWGCLEDGKDPPPPPRGLVSVRIKVTSAHSGSALASKRILVAIGDSNNQEVPYITDDFGEVALGRKEKGAKVFIRQVSDEGPAKQVIYEVGQDDPSILEFAWGQKAHIRVLLPPAGVRSSDLDEVYWETSQGIRSRLSLTQENEVRISDLSADDEVRLFSMNSNSEKDLGRCVCVEGENVIDLSAFRSDPQVVTDPIPEPLEPVPEPEISQSGRLRIVWNNFLRRPISSLKYGLHGTSEERELNRSTNEEGIDEFEQLSFGDHHLYTRWKGQDWLIPIRHERGIEEHVIQLRRHWPWWIFILAGAILLLAVFMFWRVPYRPEVRLVDASTWAPLPSGLVEYQNFDGQIVSASAGVNGLVQLNMGERPLYKKVFQLNPETPATARAAGYLDNPSFLHYRTWYWTQDWPLALSNDEELSDNLEETLEEPVDVIVEDVSRVLSTGDRPWENCRPQRSPCSGGDCIELTVCSMDASIILVQQGDKLVSHFAVLNGETFSEQLSAGVYTLYYLSGEGWNFGSSPPIPEEEIGCDLKGYFNLAADVQRVGKPINQSFQFCLGACEMCDGGGHIDSAPADIRDII